MSKYFRFKLYLTLAGKSNNERVLGQTGFLHVGKRHYTYIDITNNNKNSDNNIIKSMRTLYYEICIQ